MSNAVNTLRNNEINPAYIYVQWCLNELVVQNLLLQMIITFIYMMEHIFNDTHLTCVLCC